MTKHRKYITYFPRNSRVNGEMKMKSPVLITTDAVIWRIEVLISKDHCMCALSIPYHGGHM